MKNKNDMYFTSNPFPVIECDIHGLILQANPAAQQVMRILKLESNATLPDDLLRVLQLSIRTCVKQEIEISYGDKICFFYAVYVAEVKRVIFYGYAVSQRQLTDKHMRRLANYDPLTQLPNRLRFMRKFSELLATRPKDSFAVLYVDIDHFEKINELYNHQVGDALLINIARRLLDCVPHTFPVARLAGDEFVILYPDCQEPSEATHLAQTILDNITQPCSILGNEIEISSTLGISFYPQDAKDPDTLIRYAGLARKRVSARNQFEFYKSYMGTIAKAQNKLREDLPLAIENQQLRLYYQPQFNLQDNLKLVGAEALVRWQHPKYGLIGPARFTHLAEESNLSLAISDWVLNTACRQLRDWHDAGFEDLSIAVNLPPQQLQNDDIVKKVDLALRTFKLPVDRLELEILETSLIKNKQAAIVVMKQLASLGVQLAIDDFGTGYSSLSYLQKLPVQHLKIDRSFIHGIGIDANSIIEAAIKMGHSMNLQIIAEGVETEKQLEYLQQHQCDKAQGYYFSEPLSAHDFLNFLMPYLVTK